MIVSPSLSASVLLLLSAVNEATAFLPNSRTSGFARHCPTTSTTSSLCASSWFNPIRTPKPPAATPPEEEGSTVSDDLAIPYDAAALLAYDEWRTKYNKGAFDEERYPIFKANYEAIAVANVIAKRKAREAGDSSVAAPAMLTLNEYADCTAEEYQAKRSGSTGDVLGKAFEAAQSQSEASNALAEAAEALAEEEELLAKQLGLESVDELEVALDSLEGIAADGGELEKDNIAREARIRSAYLEWCKENGKEPVESRFETFASNFLAMENYSRESGREMSLNKYADCTEEEYLELTGQKQTEEVKAEEEIEKVVVTAPVQEIAASGLSKADAQALAKAEAKAKADAEKKARDEELAKKKAAQEAWQKMSDDERKAAAEKEREERRVAQIKALEKLRQENEAAAIAAAKAEQEREAAQVAMRREIDRKAAELVRQKAREFEEKQKLIENLQKKKETAAPKKKAFDPLSIFSSSTAPAKPVEKKEEESPEIDRKAAELVRQKAREFEEKQKLIENLQKKKETAAPKTKAFDPLSIFSSSTAPAKPVEKKEEESPIFDVSSLLSNIAPTPPPTPPKKQEETPNPLASIFSAPETKKEVKAPKKDLADGFSFFNQFTAPAKVTPAPKAAKPVPKPAPAPKPVVAQKPVPVPPPAATVTKSNPFSFFTAAAPPAPKAAPKVSPPAQTEAKKPPAAAPPKEAFSFFGALAAPKPAAAAPAPKPAPAKVAARPAPAKAAPPKAASRPAPAPAKAAAPPAPAAASFSVFSPAPAPAPKVVAPAPPAAEQKKEPFSFFGSPKPAPAPAPKVAPAEPKKEPFSFFGSPKPAPAPKVAPAPPAPAPKKESPSFSFFGAPKPAVKAPAPKAAPSTPPAPKKESFSFFGAPKPAAAVKAAAPKKSEPKKVPPKESAAPRQVRGTISLTQLAKEEEKKSPFSFFGPKVEPKDDIPILSRWIQNEDGSITGFVSNSKNFRDNTRITTSPVRIGVKEGQVVKTGSGSQYRLN